MMDHTEEQELEAEALTAIFDTSFEIISQSPNHWKITLFPVDCSDETESEEANHVGCKLVVNLPEDYPESSPNLDIELIKGLAQEQKEDLLKIALDEAEQYLGMPAIFSVCEAMKEWLVNNNIKGLDDQSMHAQMMRRAREEELKKEQKQQEFESQKLKEELTQAESEEIAVRKRRAEGTPCTKENFYAWKEKFELEMEEKAEKEAKEALKDQTNSKKSKNSNMKSKEEEMEGRLTGFQQFSEKLGLVNLDALEKAAEEAGNVDVEDLDVDEDLFDDESDLDDLDFDDEEESDDEDEEEDDDLSI